MLTRQLVGVQWDRVIVHRRQASSHRGMHSNAGAAVRRFDLLAKASAPSLHIF